MQSEPSFIKLTEYEYINKNLKYRHFFIINFFDNLLLHY